MRWIDNERTARWIVGLAAGLVYLNSFVNGFVFDDLVAVRDNPVVNQPRLLFHAFLTDYWRGTSVDLLYRPLTVFTYGLNNLLHGMRPAGFHLVNVLLHVFVSLTVLRLVTDLFQNARLALLTGLMFALHPIHTEAVASIVGRAELLMTLFTLLALRYYLQATNAPTQQARHKFISCLLCYLLACLSKENGIMAPALLLLAEITLCFSAGNWDRFRGPNTRRALVCYGTLTAVGVAYLLVRFAVLGNLTLAHAAEQKFTVRGTLVGFEWPLQFANALQYFGQYLRLLLFPLRLSSDYSFDQMPAHASIWHWDIGIGAVALVLMIVLALGSIRRATPVLFGLGVFFVAFLPTSNFIIPILTTLAERTLYLPSFGFLLALAWPICRLLEKTKAPNVGAASAPRPSSVFLYGCVGLLLVLYSSRTILRNRDWHDEIALFTSATRACPKCGNAWNCLGDALAEARRYPQAIDAYQRSLEIIPDHGVFHFRMANALRDWGKHAEAVEAYKKAIEHEPMLSDACDELARSCIAAGDLDQALHWSLKAVGIQPDKAVFRYNLGYIFQRQGKLREALKQYREAATLNPAEPSYAFNLGLVYRDLDDLDQAITWFQKAVELSPANEKYWMNLSQLLLKKGALAPAALALEQFIKVSTNTALVADARQILDQIRKNNP